MEREAEFSKNPQRVKNRTELHEALAPFFQQCPRNELMDKFIAQHVPAGAVKNMEQVFASDFAQSMVLEEEIDGVVTKRVKSVGFNLT